MAIEMKVKHVVGKSVIGTTTMYAFGSGEKKWWHGWAVPTVFFGGLLLILPAIGYWTGGKIYGGGTTVPVTAPQPIVVSPVVVQQPVPVPQPSPAPQTPSASGEAKEAGDEPAPKPRPKSLWELNP